MAAQRTGTSISARVSLLTFVAVTVAAVIVSAISIAGVYRLTLNEDSARVDAYRSLLTDDLNARLGILDRAVLSLASDPATVTSPSGGITFAHVSGSDAEYFASLSLLDGAGRTMATLVSSAPPIPSQVLETIGMSVPGRTVFEWVQGATPAEGGLWVGRTFGALAHRRAVVGLVRTPFIVATVDKVVSSSSVWSLLVDSAGMPIRLGVERMPFDSGTVRYSAGETSGAAIAASARFGTMRGSWGSVGAGTGLSWRVLVFDTQSGSMARARSALTPAGMAMVVVVLLAVVSVLLYSRRLIAPLRVFERAARDIASGGYVRPIKVDRDDELGRVSRAFNEMGVRLNSLQDMAHLLASAANLNDVLDAVLAALGRILGTGDAAVLLADESGSCLVMARGKGLAVPEATLVASLDEESPLTGSFRDQVPVYFRGDDSEAARAIHRLFNADPHREGVVVPLTAGSEALGVVVVLAAGHRPLTEAHIDTLRAYSANAAVAVHASRLFADEHLARTEAEALRQVAELTVPSSDLAGAIRRAGTIAADLLGYGESDVIIERREQLGLGLSADPAADEVLLSVWRLVLASHPDRDPADSSPIVVDGAQQEPPLAAMLGPAWGRALFVPLLQARTTRGALIFHDAADQPRPNDRQIAVARSIGQELSLAIRNAHLLQDARSRATNLETVFRISQAVSSELQLTVVLNRVLDVVQKILSADAVSLMSYDDGKGTIETSMARGVASRNLLYFAAVPGEDIPGQVFESRAPLLYGELSHRPTRLAGLAADEGLESLLAVPLMARGRAIGVLAVYAREPGAFSPEDMELLMTFASQAAIAIDTAGLYGKEHHVATVLQASILPDVLPAVPGLETASFYLPLGTEAEIGGDYYDMFSTADGRVVLAIGDVCGKGVAAATKTSMVKYALRGMIGAGLGPAAALAELNRQVSGAGDPSDIVTVWLGVIDLSDDSLVYANGGHPPGLLLRNGTRAVERLAATGPLLGAIPDATYGQETVALREGDLLLLYTDGVTESRRGSHFFGEGRVRRVLRSSTDAEQCVEHLLEAVDRFSTGSLRDDAAALVVRRTGGPAS